MTTITTRTAPATTRAGRLLRSALHRVTSFVLPAGGALEQTLAGPDPARTQERPAAAPPMRVHLNAPMVDVRPLGRWQP